MTEDRGRSAERLITFTDAVVAIAVTLLALPLTEFSHELVTEGIGALLADKAPQILGFVISFFVIARLWWGHHRVFAHVVEWDTAVVYLTVLWLFTVVALAPVSAITNAFDPRETAGTGAALHYANRGVIALYIGTMTACSLTLTALAWHIRRHPELTDGHDATAGRRLANSVETSLGFLLALAIGTLLPQVNYFALLSLVLTGRIGAVVQRRRERRMDIR